MRLSPRLRKEEEKMKPVEHQFISLCFLTQTLHDQLLYSPATIPSLP